MSDGRFNITADVVGPTHIDASDGVDGFRTRSTGLDRVRVNAYAAFQLMLFSATPEVRNAAAEALWPREYAEASSLLVNDGSEHGLSYPERVAALLIASAICRYPSSAKMYRVVPRYSFDVASKQGQTRNCARIFQFGADGATDRLVDPCGRETRWTHSACFALPDSLEDTVMRRTYWGGVRRGQYRSSYRWEVTASTLRLSLGSIVRSRIALADLEPKLIDAQGAEVPGSRGSAWAICAGNGLDIEVDPEMLFALESGRLSGAVLSFSNHMPIVRSSRPRDIQLSLEIGPSLESPVIARLLKGDLSPRYDIPIVETRSLIELPSLDGALVASLDQIAQRVGVGQADRLRGSFQ